MTQIQNVQVRAEDLIHGLQGLLHHPFPISARVLRLNAAPTTIDQDPAPFPQPPLQPLPGFGVLKLRDQAALGEEVHQDPGEPAPSHLPLQGVADVHEEPLRVLFLELFQAEELPPHGDHRRVELPAVDLGLGVQVENQPGGGAGPEAEDPDGARGEDGGEGGEDVEVGGGEELEEEGYAVDVAGGVEEEEAGAGELVVGPAGDFEDSDVVVPGLESGQGLHAVRGDAILVVVAGGADRRRRRRLLRGLGLVGFGGSEEQAGGLPRRVLRRAEGERGGGDGREGRDGRASSQRLEVGSEGAHWEREEVERASRLRMAQGRRREV